MAEVTRSNTAPRTIGIGEAFDKTAEVHTAKGLSTFDTVVHFLDKAWRFLKGRSGTINLSLRRDRTVVSKYLTQAFGVSLKKDPELTVSGFIDQVHIACKARTGLLSRPEDRKELEKTLREDIRSRYGIEEKANGPVRGNSNDVKGGGKQVHEGSVVRKPTKEEQAEFDSIAEQMVQDTNALLLEYKLRYARVQPDIAPERGMPRDEKLSETFDQGELDEGVPDQEGDVAHPDRGIEDGFTVGGEPLDDVNSLDMEEPLLGDTIVVDGEEAGNIESDTIFAGEKADPKETIAGNPGENIGDVSRETVDPRGQEGSMETIVGNPGEIDNDPDEEGEDTIVGLPNGPDIEGDDDWTMQ